MAMHCYTVIYLLSDGFGCDTGGEQQCGQSEAGVSGRRRGLAQDRGGGAQLPPQEPPGRHPRGGRGHRHHAGLCSARGRHIPQGHVLTEGEKQPGVL